MLLKVSDTIIINSDSILSIVIKDKVDVDDPEDTKVEVSDLPLVLVMLTGGAAFYLKHDAAKTVWRWAEEQSLDPAGGRA